MRSGVWSGAVAVFGMLAAGSAAAGEGERELAPAAAAAVPSAWEAAPESGLAALHGGSGELLAASVQRQQALVGGNRVGDGVHTGAVSLSDGALAGAQGIFVSTLNTGNNVAIQTTLHVQIHLE